MREEAREDRARAGRSAPRVAAQYAAPTAHADGPAVNRAARVVLEAGELGARTRGST